MAGIVRTCRLTQMEEINWIAVNYFNQLYRVSNGVRHLIESKGAYASLKTLREAFKVGELWVLVGGGQ